MKTLNEITVAGNLGQDPEVKTFDNGTSLTTFSLATSSYMGKDKNTGEAKHETQWHRCTAFGNVGDIIAKFCEKGSKLLVKGEMRYRSYDNKDGVTVYLSEILVSDFLLMGGKPAEQSNQNQGIEVEDDMPY